MLLQPAQELGHRRTVTAMGGARAIDLGLVLGGTRDAGRVGRGNHRAAIVLDQHAQPVGRQHRVERDLGAALGKRGDRCFELAGLVRIGELGEIGRDLAREFALVHEQLVRSVSGKNGETERQRRMRHVAAADVEGPGDGGGVGQHRMAGAVLADRRRQPRQLVLGELAGKADRVQLDRGHRCGGLILPDDVDRVFLERHQHSAGLVGRGLQRLDLADRVQPGIEAQPRTLADIVLEPDGGRVVDQAFDRKMSRSTSLRTCSV